jgi:hypothetical protein
MKLHAIARFAASLFFAASLCFFCSAAQTSTPPKTPPTPIAPPALTQVEQLEIENIHLKFQLLRNEEDQLRNQYTAVAASITQEHPGYVLDPRSNQLVKAQTPAPASTPTKK